MIRIFMGTLALFAAVMPGLSQCTIRPAFLNSGNVVASIIGVGMTSFPSIVLFGSCPGNTNANVNFKFAGFLPSTNLLVVSPSSGTTPATVIVGVNPNALGDAYPSGVAGTVELQFTTTGQSPPYTAFTYVTLTLSTAAPPVIQSIVNAASLAPGISPRGLVSILGTSLGPNVSATYDQTGLYPTTLGFTTVTFNGTPGALVSVSAGQVLAQAPFEIAGQKTVQVVLARLLGPSNPQTSNTFSVAETDNSLAVFTTSLTYGGQPGIQNCAASCTPNSPANPAPPGSIVELYATSSGLLSATMPDATVGLLPQDFGGSLTIGGQPATILYAGPAPYELWGMIQVNAVVPSGLASGSQPAVLTFGQLSTAGQSVTIAVQ